jgi:hypothetical protein
VSSVFINYRTDDEESTATLIETELSHRFGSDEIFRASKSIAPGDDFQPVLLRTVRRSEVVLAVIGPEWLSVRDRIGRRKIDLKSDWTRRELLEAFRCDVRVIPVLIGRAEQPKPEDLPDELAWLANCQSMRFSHRNAATDLASLATALTKLVPGLKDRTVPGPRASAPEAGGISMTNKTSGNARVGVQGIVYGDVNQDGGEGR